MSSSNIAHLFGIDEYEGLKFGVEFEVEAVEYIDWDVVPKPLDRHDENSLRNGGVELVTPPITKQRALTYHRALFHEGGLRFNAGDPYSPRCSTHVHVNFSDVEESKARQFIRYYYWIEPLFFDFVANHRRNNIFCVQLSASHMLKLVLGHCSLGYMTDKWHKYTALNAKPLQQFGTIEFRHLEATKDTQRFEQWLTYITRLYDYVMDEREPLIPSQAGLMALVKEVFPTYTQSADLLKDCASNLLDDILISLSPTRELISARIKGSKACAA